MGHRRMGSHRRRRIPRNPAREFSPHRRESDKEGEARGVTRIDGDRQYRSDRSGCLGRLVGVEPVSIERTWCVYATEFRNATSSLGSGASNAAFGSARLVILECRML